MPCSPVMCACAFAAVSISKCMCACGCCVLSEEDAMWCVHPRRQSAALL